MFLRACESAARRILPDQPAPSACEVPGVRFIIKRFVVFVGFTVLIASKFASGSLPVLGIIFALALNLIFGLWPVVLQRHNRLRLYRAIDRCSQLADRQQRPQTEARDSFSENIF